MRVYCIRTLNPAPITEWWGSETIRGGLHFAHYRPEGQRYSLSDPKQLNTGANRRAD